MAFQQPLDLAVILIEKLAGTADIFILLAIAVIAILAARWKMSVGAMLLFIGLFISLIYYSGKSAHIDLSGNILPLMILLSIIAAIAIPIILTRFQK